MIYFFTYGDEKFANTKKRIESEALNSGFFDEVKIYSREDLDKDFIERTKPYIDIRGGFWMWKAFLMKKTIDRMQMDDICVYIDAGCTVNPNGKQRFLEYLDLIKDESGILSFRLDGFDEDQWTTEKIFENFEIEVDSEIRKSGHIMSTMIIFRKCERTIKLLNDFYGLALEKPVLFSDTFNYFGNSETFKDNRYDQSIFSVMRKKYGSVEIIDETYADTTEGWNNLYLVKKIPFLATRIRN